MMEVADLHPHLDYEQVQPVDQRAGYRMLRTLDGTPRAATWTPLDVFLLERLDEDAPRAFRAQCPFLLYNTLACREEVFEPIRDALGDAGEWLPLHVVATGETMWMFNVTTIIDALDTDASSIRYFATGNIQRIDRYQLRSDLLDGASAFRLPQLSSLFIAGTALDRLRDLAPTGIELTTVWTSS